MVPQQIVCGDTVSGIPGPMGQAHALWKEVSDVFHTSWDKVYQSVKYVVNCGPKHRDLNGIEAIGVDEIQFGNGHDYLTLVYQIDPENKRLLAVARERTVKSVLRSLKKEHL